MIKRALKLSVTAALLFATTVTFGAYDKNPPFSLDKLKPITYKSDGTTIKAYDPTTDYRIFVNYELGMHCVGFEMSYCIMNPFFKTSKSSFLIPPFYDTNGNSFAPLGSKLFIAL